MWVSRKLTGERGMCGLGGTREQRVGIESDTERERRRDGAVGCGVGCVHKTMFLTNKSEV